MIAAKIIKLRIMIQKLLIRELQLLAVERNSIIVHLPREDARTKVKVILIIKIIAVSLMGIRIRPVILKRLFIAKIRMNFRKNNQQITIWAIIKFHSAKDMIRIIIYSRIMKFSIMLVPSPQSLNLLICKNLPVLFLANNHL